MIWGLLATAVCLCVLIGWASVEIFRVDRIIASVDRRLAGKDEGQEGTHEGDVP